MNQIVCQFSNREGQVEFIWSSGGGFFRPYSVAGAQLVELRDATRSVRKALGEVVYAQNQAGEGPVPGESAYALAEAGFRLFNYLLPSEDDTARKVRKWLEDLRKFDSLNALEIVVEEQSADPQHFVSIPWNLVYDERPAKHKPAFQTGKSTERWRPFWSIRYNLTSGRRVEPLKRLPVWSEPRVVVVVDPDVQENLNDDQKGKLAAFLDEMGLTAASSMEELEVALEEGYPRLLYWMGHANPDYLQLGPERIAPSDLRNLLRSFDDRERPEGMLAFLNCCQTAEAGQTGSFLDVLHSFGFTGAIATEQQTIDNFANEIGLAFLRGFLQEGRPLGELLHELRLSMAPLGLLYGAHCPSEIRVKVGGDGASAAQPAIRETGRAGGVLLQARRLLAGAVAAPIELPEQPYRSLGYFDRADRALFTGREIDIVRFAARLDRSDTRILILHGESGLGKSSFLRAGVIPYLEEHCVGYRFLRRADGAIDIIGVSTDPVGQIAQSLLNVTARPLNYATPDGEPITIELRRVLDEMLGGPADFEALRAALAKDAGFFAAVLARMAVLLPHALVLIIDQAEELFTLARSPTEIAVRDHTLLMIQRLVDLKADVKVIITLRTEYIGRLLDHLRAGRPDHLSGVRDDLLRDFSLEALISAIERPTSEVPIAEGRPSPREKYGFRFDDGVAARIAKDVLDFRTEHQDSVLPLIQVICTQLYERARSQPGSDRVITLQDLEAIRGVEGGLKAFAEAALERTLALSPSDQSAFKALFARLYSRQVDGTLTTWLAPRDSLEKSWSGSKPFAQVVESAVSVRILREDNLRVEGAAPRPYIRLGHDALAKVAAAWQAERDEAEHLREERAKLELERKKRRDQIRKLVAGLCAAACVAVLFGATAVSAIQQKRRAEASEHRAIVSKDQALRSQAESQHDFRIAFRGFDDLLTQVADVDLADIPQMERVRRDLLERAKVGYEELRKSSGSRRDPEFAWVTARATERLGEIEEMLGDYGEAEATLRDAIRLLAALITESPDDAYRRELLRCHLGLGVLLKKSDRFAEAAKELHAAEEIRRSLGSPGDAADRQLRADLDHQRGALLAEEAARNEGAPIAARLLAESEQAYRAALAIQEPLVAESQGKPGPRAKFGRYLNNLGKALTETGRFDEAEAAFEQAIRLVEGSGDDPGSRWQRARATFNLGVLRAAKKETATALESIRSATAMLERLAKEYPGIPQYRQELATMLARLGGLEHKRAAEFANSGSVEEARGQVRLAEEHMKSALELRRRLIDESPKILPEYRLRYADLLSEYAPNRREPSDAERLAREAVRQMQLLNDAYQPAIPEYVDALGFHCRKLAVLLLIDLKRPADAREPIDRAIRYGQRALDLSPDNGGYRVHLCDAYWVSSRILRTTGRREDAAKVAEKLPELMPDDLGRYVRAAVELAECAASASQERDVDYNGRAVGILKKAVGRGLITDARSLNEACKRRILQKLKERKDFKDLEESLKHRIAG